MNKLVVTNDGSLLFVVETDRELSELVGVANRIREHIPTFPPIVVVRGNYDVLDLREDVSRLMESAS